MSNTHENNFEEFGDYMRRVSERHLKELAEEFERGFVAGSGLRHAKELVRAAWNQGYYHGKRETEKEPK